MMHSSTMRTALLALAWFSMLVPSVAQALRCGNDLVQKGDPAFRVRQVCGPPDHVAQLPSSLRYYGHVPDDQIWYYNFGSHRLLYVLRFRNDRLQTLDTEGRGFNTSKKRSRPCRPGDISIGMTGYELLLACGRPAQRDGGKGFHHHSHHHLYHRAWAEDWYYDFGRRFFLRRVRLVDDRVRHIERLP